MNAESIYVADFETTVFEGQTRTDVWASAIVNLFSEDVKIFHSIAETFNYIVNLPGTPIIYYHNLKFDGAFWLDYLLKEREFKLSGVGDEYTFKFNDKKFIKNNEVITSISNMGAWYRIVFRYKKKTIEIRDSLKLLPFSVETIGKSFGTKHKKLDLKYDGYRYPGCEITQKEQEYIKNDVLVVKEALEIMFNQGHMKLTIGSCCLSEYKALLGDDYKFYFPNLYEQALPSCPDYENVGEYIHKAYRGGWCYLVKGKKGIHTNGFTADVNSLYPSVMHSESGCYYPYGEAKYWKGNGIPDYVLKSPTPVYYYVRFSARFKIKDGYLPFIQIKDNARYKATEMLETSDVYFPSTGKHHEVIKNINGEIEKVRVTMTVTMTDWVLINEHYDLYDLKIIDGVYFDAQIGMFDRYINKYKKIKQESKGAIRTLSKLFLNNLYGKMSASTNSSFKLPIIMDDVIKFASVEEHDKQPGYIAVGAAITSYARNFTIRAAQQNYYGPDKPGFVYADTDSIHCDIPIESAKGIKIHPTDFCCWKIETEWDIAKFTRQKTYIEHVTKEDGEPVTPHYDIKCAGMPKKCKALFESSMTGILEKDREYTAEEKDFLSKRRTLDDFDIGLTVPGKLIPKRIPGGILLTETTYEMR